MKFTSSAVAAILLLSVSTSALPITPEPFVERSIFGSLIGTAAKDVAKGGAGDAAKVAGKAASGGILSHLKNAAITGVEGLVGTEAVSKIADAVDPGLASGSEVSGAQTNSTDSSVEARSLFGSLVSTVAKDGAKDASSVAAKAASGAAKAAGDAAKAAGAKGAVDAANILEKLKKVGKQDAGDLVRVRREPGW